MVDDLETEGATTSAWMDTSLPHSGRSLPQHVDTDVCIVGAGISGLSVAYTLVERGLRVVVIDDGCIGGGETARTTAHLASYLDDRFSDLESLHGFGGAALAYQSHAAAIDRIEAICARESILCDFKRVDGYLFDREETRTHNLKRELEAAHRAGMIDCELVEQAPLIEFATGRALRFPRQAQLHPIKYLRGLATAVTKAGGVIYEGVHATEIAGGESPIVTTATGATIHAKDVVVATNAPINSKIELPLKQAAYRTYVIGLIVPTALVMPALYWDFDQPYHYARLVGEPRIDGSDVLLVGGEDHRTGKSDEPPEARYQRLEIYARTHFPMCAEVIYKWSGQVMEPIDGLAFLGKSPNEEHVYIATGDSGQGMTHGTIAGVLISDLIVGTPNPWATLYDPSRRTIGALGSFLSETTQTIGSYADWARGADVTNTDAIEPDTGAIMQRGLAKLAVFKDAAGVCHERSATCPHLGGVVRWNAAEKSWDCPCHGSRFAAHGKVINGPANRDLDEVPSELPQEEPVESDEALVTSPSALAAVGIA